MVRRLTRSERLSGYNPRLDEERCKAMNESKVEVIFGHDCNVSTAYTTHADYRALEDENRSLRASFDEAHELWTKAAEELASIKARVGGIEKKDQDLCNLEYANGWNACRMAMDVVK